MQKQLFFVIGEIDIDMIKKTLLLKHGLFDSAAATLSHANNLREGPT